MRRPKEVREQLRKIIQFSRCAHNDPANCSPVFTVFNYTPASPPSSTPFCPPVRVRASRREARALLVIVIQNRETHFHGASLRIDVKQNRRSSDLTDGRIFAGYTALDRQEVRILFFAFCGEHG